MSPQPRDWHNQIYRIVVSPAKLNFWVLGPQPVLQTFRDKKPFSRHGGLQKERVIVSGAGRRRWAIKANGSDAPASRSGVVFRCLLAKFKGSTFAFL